MIRATNEKYQRNALQRRVNRQLTLKAFRLLLPIRKNRSPSDSLSPSSLSAEASPVLLLLLLVGEQGWESTSNISSQSPWSCSVICVILSWSLCTLSLSRSASVGLSEVERMLFKWRLRRLRMRPSSSNSNGSYEQQNVE